MRLGTGCPEHVTGPEGEAGAPCRPQINAGTETQLWNESPQTAAGGAQDLPGPAGRGGGRVRPGAPPRQDPQGPHRHHKEDTAVPLPPSPSQVNQGELGRGSEQKDQQDTEGRRASWPPGQCPSEPQGPAHPPGSPALVGTWQVPQCCCHTTCTPRSVPTRHALRVTAAVTPCQEAEQPHRPSPDGRGTRAWWPARRTATTQPQRGAHAAAPRAPRARDTQLPLTGRPEPAGPLGQTAGCCRGGRGWVAAHGHSVSSGRRKRSGTDRGGAAQPPEDTRTPPSCTCPPPAPPIPAPEPGTLGRGLVSIRHRTVLAFC